jgi:gluconate 5-dehydrogenase
VAFQSIESLFSLQGKVALLTGAAGYFGRVFAESLCFAGAKVILYDKDASVINLADSLKSEHGNEKVDCYQVDFYDENAYRKSLSDTVDKNKSIDILVNNAFEFSKNTGFNDPSGKLDTISRNQWLKSFDSGVYWHALATQIIGSRMKSHGSGSIINMCSMYAIVSPDPALYEGTTLFNPPSYGAAKAALLAFTRYVASFYGQYGIRCNAIIPGAFPNVGGDSYNSVSSQEFLQRLANRTVLRRVGNVDDLKGALIFLASDASRYVTGQGIVVDGGWTIR